MLRLWKALALAALVSLTAGAGCLGPGKPPPDPAEARNVSIPPPEVAQILRKVPSPNGDRLDPYFWMRDDSRKRPAVLEHLAAENRYTERMTAHAKALEEKLYKEILSHIQEDDSTVPVLDHGWWYSTRYAQGQQHGIHVRRRGRQDAPEQVILDENQRAQGQPYYSAGALEVSPNARLLAFTEDVQGSGMHRLSFKNLDSGQLLPDRIEGVDPGVAWADDNKTVLYVAKDPVTLLGSRVMKHVLGTPQSKDTLVYEEPDKRFFVGVARSKSDQYLYIVLQATDVTEWRYAKSSDPKLAFKTFLPRERGHEYEIEHAGKDFVVRTNWKAPNFRIMLAPVDKTADRGKWRDLVPPKGYVFIEDFEVFRDHVVINERSAGLLNILIKDLGSGRQQFIRADEGAYTFWLQPTPQFDSTTARFAYASPVTPTEVYDYDMKTGQRTLLKRQPVPAYDPALYQAELVWAPSRDGLKIPVSLVRRKDVPKDGTASLLIRGYGAYGSSSNPMFSRGDIVLLDRGMVVATAHVRGGQEMGRDWYEQGRLLNKKNSFNDFIDATEFLLAQKYAAPGKVFAEGGSAGGLLMGAVANLRPDLYRGIVAQVPFVDIVTTMLDDKLPLTSNEYEEWGDPRQKPFYDYMLSYSPYDNVSAQRYPAILIEAGLWDGRVPYWEAAKWAAKLRANRTGYLPVLLKTNLDAGHAGASGRYAQFQERAFEFAFVLDQLGIRQ